MTTTTTSTERSAMKIVAETTSRHGGRLGCGHVARSGDPIVKMDDGSRGRQTKGKNGQGVWWCAACANRLLQETFAGIDEMLASRRPEGGAA